MTDSWGFSVSRMSLLESMSRPQRTFHLVYVLRPDFPNERVPAVRRSMRWEEGDWRRSLLPALIVVAVVAAGGGASLWVAAAVAALLGVGAIIADRLILRRLRRARGDIRESVRQVTLTAVSRNGSVGHESPPGLAAVRDLLDEVESLHRDGLVDDDEWATVRWQLWDTLDLSPRSRDAAGWSAMQRRLASLRSTAAERIA